MAKIPIPNDGAVVAAGGAAWVVDRAGGSVTAGTPDGSIYRVDASSNEVTDRVRGVAAGQGAAGFGAVWLASFEIDRLLRVDMTTHTVTRLESGPSDDEGVDAVATTATDLWVTNHHAGTVAEIDPRTGAIRRSVRLVDPGTGGPQNLLAEGSDLWVEIARDNALLRLDTTTGALAQRVAVPGGTCGGLASDPAHIWVAAGECGDESLSVIDWSTGRAAKVPDAWRFGYVPSDVTVAFGSVWVTANRASQLLRLDPATQHVVGSLSLPSTPWSLTSGNDALWVRTDGLLLRVVPQG